MNRLFIFAFYDPQGVVGASVLYTLRALRTLGDVVLSADCLLSETERAKLEGLAQVVSACRHGEYDFGSYKRGLQAVNLQPYRWVYLVNDSVFGPLRPLEPSLEKMESAGADAVGLVFNPSRHGKHFQSWFLGFDNKVFSSSWFQAFFDGVSAAGSKEEVCVRYETGLSRLLQAQGVTSAHLFVCSGKSVYNRVDRLFDRGLPFVKKGAFTRHGGSLGGRVKHILDRTDPVLRDAIVADMDRLQGPGYMARFLTRNPFRLLGRYLKYLFGKLSSSRASL